MNENTISSRKFEIHNARSQKMREVMQQYDNEVYYPALEALRKECKTIGHVKSKSHDNGVGCSWFYCGRCGARMDIRVSNGKVYADDDELDAERNAT